MSVSRPFMSVSVDKLNDVRNTIKKIKPNSQLVMDRTVSDMRTRVPSWVAASVTGVYNIKKKAINSPKPRENTKTAKSLDEISFIYSGYVKTPVSFGLKPKEPKRCKGKVIPYQISMEVFRGKRKVLPPGVFLGGTGYSGSDDSGVRWIPFQRAGVPAKAQPSRRRNFTIPRPVPTKEAIDAIRTVSIPQMISNAKVSAVLGEKLGAEIQKRLDHHISRITK